MIHPDEEKLTAFCLDLIEEASEREQLANHIVGCEVCKAALGLIEADIGLIAGLSMPPLRERYPIPLRRASIGRYLLRAAAVLAIVVVFGSYFVISRRVTPVSVEPMHLLISWPPDSIQARLAGAVDGLQIKPLSAVGSKQH